MQIIHAYVDVGSNLIFNEIKVVSLQRKAILVTVLSDTKGL
jgi:hypothetical protein